MKLGIFAVGVLGAWLVCGPVLGQVPSKDMLPPPTELPGQRQIVSIRIVPGPQQGQRNVWELYSVDSRGRFLPRVVMDPRGDFYLSNGRPYPYTVTGSRSYMPWAVD